MYTEEYDDILPSPSPSTTATTDWTKQGITMATADPPCPLVSSFHSAYDVVFLDSTGLLNVCAAMSTEQFRQLQHEARLSMQCLDSTTVNAFEALFMKPVNLVEKCDALVQ